VIKRVPWWNDNIIFVIVGFNFQARYFKNVIVFFEIDGSKQDGNIAGNVAIQIQNIYNIIIIYYNILDNTTTIII